MSKYIVIPSFNEEATISKVVKSALNYTDNIIVVDNCSSDNTSLKASEAGATVLRLNENKGYEKAIDQGLRFAESKRASIVLTMDADGQHPTDYIPIFFNLIEKGNYKLVIGIRDKLPRISEFIFSFITNIRYGVKDITCGMKCYDISIYNKYGFGTRYKSIGTYLSIKSLRMKERYKTIKIPIKNRTDLSRFGINFKSEFLIMKAMYKSFFY